MRLRECDARAVSLTQHSGAVERAAAVRGWRNVRRPRRRAGAGLRLPACRAGPLAIRVARPAACRHAWVPTSRRLSVVALRVESETAVQQLVASVVH